MLKNLYHLKNNEDELYEVSLLAKVIWPQDIMPMDLDIYNN